MATSIVLAGGRSVRLGKDKAAELIGGESLLHRVLSRLSTFSTEIILVLSQDQEEVPESSYPGVRIIRDIFQGGGALGGVYTGLIDSPSSHNLVVACDMPFLNVPLLRYLLEISPPFDVVVPKVGDSLEPLHAVYSRNCIAPMKCYIEQSKRKIHAFIPQMNVRYVEEEEINRFDPEHMSFFNINTQEDLERTRQWVMSGKPSFSQPIKNKK